MSKKLNIGVIDLVSKGPANTIWARIMHANLASIMPQVVATWCEEEGHDVKFVCYTGFEDLDKELAHKFDIVFICAFTQAAFLSYAMSNFYRKKGAVTVLGGPHARCYPDDSIKYFDYVLGMTNKSMIVDVLKDHSRQNPGIHISAKRQPTEFPGIKERWKFVAPTLKKAPFVKFIPMMASVGCPYTCSFCIDATVPYQQLSFEALKEDLTFLLTKFKNPMIAWQDPNFGIRFKDTMEAISAVSAPGKFQFLAESSLSILTEEHLKIMREHNFKALLPGIESWYEMGNKSMASNLGANAKLNQVSDHVNMVLEYVPYIQTNFVLGLDCDSGAEPFELTKQFVDKSPGAFPGYSLLTSFGEAAPLNLEYQKEGRVLPLPFHFLNNHLGMNLKPKNYEWVDFYTRVIDLTEYTFSRKAIYNRFFATKDFTSKWMNVMRAVSNEGYGRIRFYKMILKHLKEDRSFRDYFEGESDQMPALYDKIIRKDLGEWMQWLPQGALQHDQNAYMRKHATHQPEKVRAGKSVVASA
jgi:hypothetical protein